MKFTLEQLLDHTAGIPKAKNMLFYENAYNDDLTSNLERIKTLCSQEKKIGSGQYVEDIFIIHLRNLTETPEIFIFWILETTCATYLLMSLQVKLLLLEFT